MLYKMNQTEKTQTYKITCPNCKTVKRGYHKEFFNIVCLACKKEFGEKEVLKQLGKYKSTDVECYSKCKHQEIYRCQLRGIIVMRARCTSYRPTV